MITNSQSKQIFTKDINASFFIIIEYLDEVEVVHVNGSNRFLWKRPHTDEGIELEYNIVLMYTNGTIVDNATNNAPEYSLPLTFDKCQFVVLIVVTKASCGEASSNSSTWNGTVLSEL